MYALYSEWDIGEQHIIFASKEAATNWLRANPYVQEMAADDNQPIEQFVYEGMEGGDFDLVKLTVIE